MWRVSSGLSDYLLEVSRRGWVIRIHTSVSHRVSLLRRPSTFLVASHTLLKVNVSIFVWLTAVVISSVNPIMIGSVLWSIFILDRLDLCICLIRGLFNEVLVSLHHLAPNVRMTDQ